MIFDVSNRYPRAYFHRHKRVQRTTGFTNEGSNEIRNLLGQIEYFVEGVKSKEDRTFTVPLPGRTGERQYVMKAIYDKYPHGVADNHFSGDNVLTYAGGQGFGLTLTTRRDRFSKGLKAYMHSEKLQPDKSATSKAARAKVMRYHNPIVAIKQVPATPMSKAYTMTHTSFQSTGATNISGVNNLPSCSLYVSKKSRGRGGAKRVWGIEQNEARETYLGHYYAIDNVDHMIKLAQIRFISWKYWHAPFLHAFAIAIIAAYDMYIECAQGELEQEWSVPENERLDFQGFRLLCSEIMLQYDAKKQMYPGDGKMRAVSRQHKKRRANTSPPKPAFYPGGLSVENFKLGKTMPGSRLCGDLSVLSEHLQSVTCTSNSHPCEVCGAKTLWKCRACNKYACTNKKKKWNGAKCLMALHDDGFFGLCRSDHKDMHSKNVATWRAPSEVAYRRNRKTVENLKELMEFEQLDFNVDEQGLDSL